MNEEYVLELYSYLGSADETFQDNLSQEDFVEAMKQKQYAAQIYQYLGNLDEDYKNQVPVQDFMTAIGIGEVKVDPLNPEVKKKDDSESPSGLGSSDSPAINTLD